MKKLLETLIRDLFAAFVLHGFLAGNCGQGTGHDDLAEEAYDFADAMMRARKR